MARRSNGNTTLPLSRLTAEELGRLKQRAFGAEETWDHLLRRLAALPERSEDRGRPHVDAREAPT